MTIPEILNHLDTHEIDYRLESNFCCGYIFYFLDGSIYPRRMYDDALDGIAENIEGQSVENMIERSVGWELKKDWKFRIEGKDIVDTFIQVENHLNDPKYFMQ